MVLSTRESRAKDRIYRYYEVRVLELLIGSLTGFSDWLCLLTGASGRRRCTPAYPP